MAKGTALGRYIFVVMICAYVAKPLRETRGLILNRKKVTHLTDLLKGKLGYPPFVCNTQRGLYVFCDRMDCEENIKAVTESFVREHANEELQFLTPYASSSYFYKEIAAVLNDESASAFAWKNFMSSFLVQLDPFYGELKSVHSLFKDFVAAVKTLGNDQQLLYLKRKMNVLRQRVELNGLIELED